MNLFKKLFGSTSKEDNNPAKDPEHSKFMPDPKLPTDENFMVNFKKNGGKFLYCGNQNEMLKTFDEVLTENDWHNGDVYCLDSHLIDIYKEFDLHFTQDKEADFFLSSCEYLIADTGALLISSNQIKEKKLIDLPANFVVLATTSQLIDTIGEGLRGIKANCKGSIPSNITTIKTFEEKQDSDFMSYGSTSKNLYLLLLEDL